jgi:hypothetical protein
MTERFNREAGRDRDRRGRAAGEAALTVDSPFYGTDAFRIQCFKVLPCSSRATHEW